MSTATTSSETVAFLSDGRHVQIPDSAVQDWKYAVTNDDTTLGLGDWYTDLGEEHTDEIRGEVSREPFCTPTSPCKNVSVRSVRVTNESQVHQFTPGATHASVWVCRQRSCILDAMSWVERSTGERAVWLELGGIEVHHELPPYEKPLSTEMSE